MTRENQSRLRVRVTECQMLGRHVAVAKTGMTVDKHRSAKMSYAI